MKKQPKDYKNNYPDFSYENLTRNLTKQFQKIDSNGYWAFLGGAGNSTSFYLVNSSKKSALKTVPFNNRNPAYLATLPIYVQYKLQFHIALSEEKNNLHEYKARGQAWDIIKDILINHEVRDFKIIRSTEAMSDSKDGHQTGKDVTVDAYIEPQRSLEKWNTILNEIHAKLLEYSVPLPSEGAKSSSQRGKEYTIVGTKIITYRYDIPLPTESRDFIAESIRISPYAEIKTVDFTSTSQISADTGSTSSISSTHLAGITQKKVVTIHPRPRRMPTVASQQLTGTMPSPISTSPETKHSVTTPLIVPTSQAETRKENKLIVRSEAPILQETKSSTIVTTATTSISTSTEVSTAVTSIPGRPTASQIASVGVFSPPKKPVDNKQKTKQLENPPSSCCLIL